MENQHRKIVGYRELTAVEIDLMNEIKLQGERMRELLQRVKDHAEAQVIHAQATQDIAEMERLDQAEPLDWHDQARRALQAGIMAAVRAVAQPTTF